MSKSELLPCPFCGGEAEVYGDRVCLHDGREYFYPSCKTVGCPGGMTPDGEFGYNHIMAETEKEAISIWNTRVYPKEVQEALEKQKPKKPAGVLRKGGFLLGPCRSCGAVVNTGNRFCRICGQKQDWSGYE